MNARIHTDLEILPVKRRLTIALLIDHYEFDGMFVENSLSNEKPFARIIKNNEYLSILPILYDPFFFHTLRLQISI